jgi:hypothetical protein
MKGYVAASLAGGVLGPMLALLVLGRFFGESNYEEVGIPAVLTSAILGAALGCLWYGLRRRRKARSLR